jgi:putative ABC transport system permease protein
MFDLDSFREVLDTLRRNALRTGLTAVGVFWGVFMLIVMVGFGNGLEEGAKSKMMGTATNSLFVWSQRSSLPYAGLSPGRLIRLTLDDADTLRGLSGVSAVAPRASLGGRRGSHNVSRNHKSGSFTVMGDTPSYLEVTPLEIRGRFVNQLDMARRRKVAVIGERVVELLFKRGEDPIGQSITIRGAEFMVVGVLKTTATGDRGANDAATVHTPLSTFQRVLSHSEYVDYIAVLSASGVRVAAIEEPVRARLRKRHRVAPGDGQAIQSWNMDAEYQKVVNLFVGISLLVYLVGTATLLAGLVGVSNIMMVSVRERTREIGIRKAIGATPRTVIGQVVLEAVALAGAAGYMGLVIGVAAIELAGAWIVSDLGTEDTMFAAPSISLFTATMAASLVVVGGAVAGFFPALRAAGIRTVIALRDE